MNLNFAQTERTWPQGMKGMTNGMVPVTLSCRAVAVPIAPKGNSPLNLVRTEMTWRQGMKGMTNGMVVVVCKKGSSI